jgi:diguanylate cyclase (GGDEF)-like protein
VFQHLNDQSRGTFISDMSIDEASRLYAYYRVGNLPLVVVVSLSVDEILTPWRWKMLVLALIFTVMATGVVALVWMLEEELRRRAAAERAAEELARTDGLTRLANRRWFDETLANKWAQSLRDGRPMSLLMIDVDCFKIFNDSYGHQAGDRILARIADVIDGAVRRPDDFAARYGGEEFVVLLPDTDRGGAKLVAETICEKVRALQINHAGSRDSIVTVSVGAATSLPRAGMTTAAHLIHNADTALYRAKADGRNRACISNVMSGDFEPLISRAS